MIGLAGGADVAWGACCASKAMGRVINPAKTAQSFFCTETSKFGEIEDASAYQTPRIALMGKEEHEPTFDAFLKPREEACRLEGAGRRFVKVPVCRRRERVLEGIRGIRASRSCDLIASWQTVSFASLMDHSISLVLTRSDLSERSVNRRSILKATEDGSS